MSDNKCPICQFVYEKPLRAVVEKRSICHACDSALRRYGSHSLRELDGILSDTRLKIARIGVVVHGIGFLADVAAPKGKSVAESLTE